MNIKEVEELMCSAAQEVIDECTKKLSSLPQNAKLEIKAQKIRKNMASICQAYVKMFEGRNPIQIRRKILSTLTDIPDDCTDEEITYLHALYRIEDVFIKNYSAELVQAKKFNDDENIFKLETQLDVMNHITKEWRRLGKEEGYRDEH